MTSTVVSLKFDGLDDCASAGVAVAIDKTSGNTAVDRTGGNAAVDRTVGIADVDRTSRDRSDVAKQEIAAAIEDLLFVKKR
jgi:hypothetical protein